MTDLTPSSVPAIKLPCDTATLSYSDRTDRFQIRVTGSQYGLTVPVAPTTIGKESLDTLGKVGMTHTDEPVEFAQARDYGVSVHADIVVFELRENSWKLRFWDVTPLPKDEVVVKLEQPQTLKRLFDWFCEAGLYTTVDGSVYAGHHVPPQDDPLVPIESLFEDDGPALTLETVAHGVDISTVKAEQLLEDNPQISERGYSCFVRRSDETDPDKTNPDENYEIPEPFHYNCIACETHGVDDEMDECPCCHGQGFHRGEFCSFYTETEDVTTSSDDDDASDASHSSGVSSREAFEQLSFSGEIEETVTTSDDTVSHSDPAEILRESAELHEQKNAEYGDAWKLAGETMARIASESGADKLDPSDPQQMVSLCLYVQRLHKVIRGINLELRDADPDFESLEDSHTDELVYAAMHASIVGDE